MSNASSRLRLLLTEDKLSQVDFAQTVKRSEGTVSSYLNSEGGISDKFLRIVEDRLGWSARWIRTGEGPKRIAHNPPNQINPPEDFQSPYNGKYRGSTDKLNCWWVPAKAEAGFIRGFVQRLFPSQIERISMPFVQGECFGFEVGGFSMFPDYVPGSHIVCTTLEDATWLIKGKVYVFQTAEGLIIKYFDRIEDEKIYMTAANNTYNPVQPIPLADIQQLYNIEFDLLKPKHRN